MNGAEARDALGRARLMLLFTPSLCGARDPLEVLALVLDEPRLVDVVQVRVKDAEHPKGASPARALFEWTERVLAVVGDRALVLVNDRVDVCAALRARGVAGVHLGDRDTPPHDARALLGPDALIGLSTHSAADVARAYDEREAPVDYLGFGPVFPTATKGYDRGLGPEAAWVAAQASPVPLFPIGGIAPDNAAELDHVGRACVGSAILGARDPRAAAAAIRAALERD